MPLFGSLRRCRLRLKYLLVLTAVSLSLACVFVFVFQPLPVNLHHLFTWENCPDNSRQEDVSNMALSLDTADERGIGATAADLGTSSLNYMNDSEFLSTTSWSSSRAVCVGSNASLGEVEDLLCLVSSFAVSSVPLLPLSPLNDQRDRLCDKRAICLRISPSARHSAPLRARWNFVNETIPA